MSATIVYQDVNGFGAATTSPGITLPASPDIQAGDLIVCAWQTRANTTAPIEPAGFTVLESFSSTSTALLLCAKVAVGNEESTVIAPTSAQNRYWSTVVFIVRGGPSNLSLLIHANAAGGPTATSAPTSVTTAVNDTLVITSAFVNSLDSDPITPPTGWTAGDATDTGSGTGLNHAATAYKVQATAGATTAGEVWTTASGTPSWHKWTLAIQDGSVNQLPTVGSIIPDSIAVRIGEVTSATATASDTDGTIASYNWSQYTTGTDMVAPTLSGASTATVTFTPTELGAFTLQVTATDNNGGVSPPAYVGVIVVPAETPGTQVRIGGNWQAVDGVETIG